ncbi:MAG: alpha/beta hydrolase fold domain-containing protein [Rubrivivax sp.]|nr:alpha/beta hydrolase fold domain-containing protein [Rubrivivax sp.]
MLELHPAAAADRERAYSPSSCIGGDYQPFLHAYAQGSAQAHDRAQQLGGRWISARYGSAPAQRIQLCLPPPPADRAGAGCGLLVFIHGGYWQELSAADSLFAAARCIEAGQAFAAIDYTLAPLATVAGIIQECRQAFAWLMRQAPWQGIDASRVVVAGSSAGAHLAACVGLGTQDEAGPVPPPRALVLASGLYDLSPLLGTSINEALQLDETQARACSPLHQPLAGFPRALLCWGEVETEAFKAQSRHFALALADAGAEVRSFEVPGRNHFDLILDLAEPGTRLGDATQVLLAPR